MTRFIIVIFALLGLVFYEMSGGADFDPDATRLSRIEQPAEGAAAPIETAQSAPAESVTRVTLNLTSVEDVVRTKRTLRTKPAVQTAAVVTDQNAVSEEEPTVILPSLLVDRPVITPVEFGGDAATGEIGSDDLRRVTGNRVNVRGGPGTNYSVVNRLQRGDEVEILQDPGTGWVKLRPAGGGTVGWMADFLLSEG
ncbi:MAG: SH3 domain-containing protein [Pseudomonadota bacterium]